jgi:hypothetical protein
MSHTPRATSASYLTSRGYVVRLEDAEQLELDLIAEGNRLEAIGEACGFPKVTDHAQLTETICKTIRRVEKDNYELSRELAEAREHRDRLAALVGSIRGGLNVPVRNVSDITTEQHSHEIGDAIDAIKQQRDRLEKALSAVMVDPQSGKAFALARAALKPSTGIN